MRRFALALSVCVVGLAVSSCAVGVRQAATEITQTSATLNGQVLSTTGGPGSWYIEYGAAGSGIAEKTPTRAIEFVANEAEPVSEPIDGLDPGTTYHYAVCAEDSENPGDPFCSPDQTFTTDFDAVDSVAGAAAEITNPVECQMVPGPACLRDRISVETRSDAAGNDPTGSINLAFSAGSRGATFIDANVTCLSVSGKVAVIGALGDHSGPMELDFYPVAIVVRVTDGGGPASAQDTWEILASQGDPFSPPPPAPTNCSTFSSQPPGPSGNVNQEGDLTVIDAPAAPSSRT